MEIGNATLYLGDARELLPELRADAVVTDPPYGFKAYSSDTAYGVREALRPVSHQLAVFGYPELLVALSIDLGAPPIEWIAWAPTNKVRYAGKALLPRAQECVAIWGTIRSFPMVARATDATTNAISSGRGLDVAQKVIADVWTDASPGMGFNSHLRSHPNEKPVIVMERLVQMMADPGQGVLDPFMGSGTTGVACANLGRAFIGVELEREFFDIACRRIEAAQAQQRLFA